MSISIAGSVATTPFRRKRNRIRAMSRRRRTMVSRTSMFPGRSVLLDLDGTVVDSQPGIFASCLAALRALGHDPGEEALDIKHVIGPPLEDVLRVLLKPYGDDRTTEAVAAYRHHYGES